MLSENTIQLVRELQVSDVLRHYVPDLKHKGANWIACCPFHGENTPSFAVNDAKGIFKCFGCGEGGDAIAFVMSFKKMSFLEAVEAIASNNGIPVEREEMTEAQQLKYQQRLTEIEQQEKVLNYVVPVYQKLLHNLPETHPAKAWLRERKLDDETIAKWQLGWGGDEWNTVTSSLINMNLWGAASKLNISKHSADNTQNYDVYRSRIIFPIKDRNGKIIGIGGRAIVAENKLLDEKSPKYINPAECEIYNKSAVLYGLSDAEAAIKEKGSVYVTEGYMDVISPHLFGLKNTVATCGTSFTREQMNLLKKHTSHVIIWRDEDAAGYTSFVKALPELLTKDFRVEFAQCKPATDPDTYCRQANEGTAPITYDALKHYAQNLMEKAGKDNYQVAHAKQDILKMLALIKNEIIRNNYLDQIIKLHGWKAGDTKKEFASIMETIVPELEEADEDIKFDAWVTPDEKDLFMETGYLGVKRKRNGKPMCGYYSFGPNGKTMITNFIVNPLFRIEAGGESRYISELDNGYTSKALDLPAKLFVSPDQFQANAVAFCGNFVIHGSRSQWLRIASDLLQRYNSCMEITSLGWQEHGFYSYVDKCFVPDRGLIEYDKWGIVEHKERKFLLPASSEAFKQLQAFGSDPYEHLRYLTFKQATVSLDEWLNLMAKVYKQKGIVAIAYVILTVFRDIVFFVDNNCPHLYGFGEPSSGKSKWAESIAALFYFRRAAFNLNTGTDFSFNSYVSSFSNSPAHLNEFDVEVVKPEWFQQIKGFYDGEGRTRGKMGSKNAVEIQKVASTIVLTGQKLVTADDNSVVTRSIIEGFGTETYTEQENRWYNELKEIEGRGINSLLLSLLSLRNIFEDKYKNLVNDTISEWRKEKSGSIQLNQRILLNYAHLSSCYQLASEKITLPQPADQFKNYCFERAKYWCQFIRNSDTLSEFWRTLEFMANEHMVEDGWDFIIEECTSVNLMIDRNDTQTVDFTEPRKVLFLRLNNIHKLFQKEFRTRTGKEAMSIENILHYFKSRKYFLGRVKAKRFNRFVTVTQDASRFDHASAKSVRVAETSKKKEEKVTSCYAFYYEYLDIDISREIEESEKLPF